MTHSANQQDSNRWNLFIEGNGSKEFVNISGRIATAFRGVIERLSDEEVSSLPPMIVFAPGSEVLTALLSRDKCHGRAMLYLGKELEHASVLDIERAIGTELAALSLGCDPETMDAAKPRYSKPDYEAIRALLVRWNLTEQPTDRPEESAASAA